MKSIVKVFVLGLLFSSMGLMAQDLQTIKLPGPDTIGGKPLMAVLKNRKTVRSFREEKLSPQTLSNLLWAAFGINRPDGHRTAPSAMNWQEIDIYAAMNDGVYRYNAGDHTLQKILKNDIREKTGMQSFVKDAPLNLVYVADLSKTKRASGEELDLFTGADCGFIAENVYLYCASEGLATVVRGSVDRGALSKILNLKADQKIILAQTVGYPSK